jgi:hypothetical protein
MWVTIFETFRSGRQRMERTNDKAAVSARLLAAWKDRHYLRVQDEEDEDRTVVGEVECRYDPDVGTSRWTWWVDGDFCNETPNG